ncbi:MAG: DUF7305 domain-containing protein [Candidatus Caldatribacteriaceae bacterium]
MIWERKEGQEKGSILITFLIVTAVFALVLGAGVGLMMGGYKRTSSVAQRNQAYYLAEAGVEKALKDLQSGCRLIEATSAPFPPSSPIGTYEYFVTSSLPNTVIITSTGVTSSGKSVTLTVHVRCATPTPTPTSTPTPTLPPLDMALFAVRDIILQGNIEINGDVGSNGEIELRGNARINGKQRENLGYTYPLPSFTPPPNLPPRGDLVIKQNKIVKISGDAYYNSISVDNNAALIVNVGSSTQTLWVKSLAVDGRLEVIGTGTLILYVESFSVGNKAKLNYATGSRTESLVLYYAGTQSVTIGNQAVIRGLVLVPGKAVVTVKGTIVGLLYAPEAQVNLGGNGQTLNGAIIVQALEEDKEAGNQKIVYAPPSPELQSLLQTFVFPSTPSPTPTPTPESTPTPTPSMEAGPPISIVGWKES